jgi:hypothetical protein
MAISWRELASTPQKGKQSRMKLPLTRLLAQQLACNSAEPSEKSLEQQID